MPLLQRAAANSSTALLTCRTAKTYNLSRGRLSFPRQFYRPLTVKSVTDDDIRELAAKPLHPLTLGDLVKHGRPPLSAQALYKSANFTLSILPTRLAHRIQSLRNLPYIVVSNPHVSKIHNNYIHSLSTLLPWAEKEIKTLEDEVKFTEVMADLVHTHGNTISILARGFLEARKYISPKEVTRFLDEHLRARIGTRLIAEQHIALHFSSKPHRELNDKDSKNGHGGQNNDNEPSSSYIGVIDTELRPASIVRHCESMVGDICELKYGVRPTVVINGEPDYRFAHIPTHLEYIVTELLKNAFRATIERGMEREPIEVTIAPLPKDPSVNEGDKGIRNLDQGNLDEASKTIGGTNVIEGNYPSPSAHIRPLEESTPGVTIRIRDRGGGISPENYARIWEYSFTTFSEDQINSTLSDGSPSEGNGMDAFNAITNSQGGSSLAGLGYGLPLGRAYAEYFGGGIAVQSLWGWGTDVYLSLRGVGKIG
ncbi:hypothetical protein W97_02898 [Coniosporium apollinis CBS 100218]|uniref:Protein-serine/threonine kinase n=1 Tax=Coniosporium apollinis (strain CBS 100218) TaxID=1168221 RepID=R7YP20_CONA1|nr:uncharacterized protein W97_02898 [Coniosporium apollinis CBS 100218]EON63670.1 hypothetical protein W97_02898 [Coniosporium apollinis CBS 100218]